MTDTAAADPVQAHIADLVATHPVVLFMKGTPAQPRCGFSAATVDVLRRYDVAVHAVDVLSEPLVRQGIKIFSDWPTIPQLYIGGAFVGGCDIIREMHDTGELGELIAAARRSAATGAGSRGKE
jgi:monothiol glutaredoxin